MKLLGIVTIFRPDTDLLRNSVMRYAKWVDELILWVNSPDTDPDILDRLNLPTEIAAKTQVMTSGRNEFISYPLNRGVEYAKANGFTHILTMDQDSLFEEGSFEKYRKIAESKDDSVIFAPRIRTPFFVDEIKHRRTIEQVNQAPELEAVEFSITSGSIYPVKIFDTTGLFREDYEIDLVDTEFGLRASLCGFITLKANTITLHQSYGASTDSHGRVVFNYSPMRRYYQARNKIMLKKEYPQYRTWAQVLTTLLKESVKILLYENNKPAKLASTLKGISEGFGRSHTRLDRAIANGTIADVISLKNKH